MSSSKFAYAANAMTKDELGGEIITQTLDTLNSGIYSGKSKKKKSYSSTQDAMSNTYELSKSVLSAAYQDKGSIIGTKS